MTIIEILNLNKELLRTFQKVGIRLEDVEYIDLFNEYRAMVANGEKVSYIVAALVSKYRVSERKVYDLIKRFKTDCNLLAVLLGVVVRFESSGGSTFAPNLKPTAMNKYHQILHKVLAEGKTQTNKKGNIRYLLNEQLMLTPANLLDIFEGHGIARKKLRSELQLFMQGERNVERYRDAGINWWDYCGSILVNSYPTYFEKLPPLIEKINREKRNSKNYVLFLGATNAESNQAPCLSLVQFQIDDGELVVSAYQRSSDANLGLPADIYHLYLMARQIDVPLKSITLFLGNVHIYENNIEKTTLLLDGNEEVKFELNV